MTKHFSAVRRQSNRKSTGRPTANRTNSSSADGASDAELPSGDVKRNRPIKSAPGNDVNDGDWAPGISTVFKILVSLRMSAGIWSPVGDCDEVYNYWEPLHMLLYGTGFQTWEYSPSYAIRSYAYVWLHTLPVRLFQTVLPHTKVTTFFYLRCFLGLCSAIADVYLYRGVNKRFGKSVGRIFVVFTAIGTGMFVASCAFLPSSFSMVLSALALGLWLHGHDFFSVLAVAVSALVGWPFAAVLGLPIVLDMVVIQRKFVKFVVHAAVSGWAVCTFLLAADSYFYGKWTLAPLNIIVYNVFGSHGPNLYGTAPISFYVLNCLLNWNLAFPLALLGVPLAAFSFRTCHSKPDWAKFTPVLFVGLAMTLWMVIFFSQPHKEERFLFPIYPFFCVMAALALDAAQRLIVQINVEKLTQFSNWVVLTSLGMFVVVSVSRSLALYHNYHAPFDTYMALGERISVLKSMENNSSKFLSVNGGSIIRICVGKEWYRYPSSFFLPSPDFRLSKRLKNNENFLEMEFIKSEFSGLLPGHFPNQTIPEATKVVPNDMNDMNREVLLRYVPVSTCDYLVDLETPETAPREPNYSIMRHEWVVIHKELFLIASKSHPILRAFFVPFLSARFCLWGRYNVLERLSINQKMDTN